MTKKSGFAFGASVLVAAFVCIVFDNLALGLISGFFAGGAVASGRTSKLFAEGRE
jgi:hypothetical protein